MINVERMKVLQYNVEEALKKLPELNLDCLYPDSNVVVKRKLLFTIFMLISATPPINRDANWDYAHAAVKLLLNETGD